jgi:hypothetical protein
MEGKLTDSCSFTHCGNRFWSNGKKKPESPAQQLLAQQGKQLKSHEAQEH